jgi:hypothetical protein
MHAYTPLIIVGVVLGLATAEGTRLVFEDEISQCTLGEATKEEFVEIRTRILLPLEVDVVKYVRRGMLCIFLVRYNRHLCGRRESLYRPGGEEAKFLCRGFVHGEPNDGVDDEWEGFSHVETDDGVDEEESVLGFLESLYGLSHPHNK